jgi:superfamily II DNA or RNA helicase
MKEIKRKRFWIYVYSDIDRRVVGKYKIGSHYGVKSEKRIKEQQTTGVAAVLDKEFDIDVTNLVNKLAGKNASHEEKLKKLRFVIEKEIREYLTINLKLEGFKEWVKTYNMNPIYTAINIVYKTYNVTPKKPKGKAPVGKYLWQDLEVIQPALKHFENNSRGNSVIYCGGGKTLISYWFLKLLKKKHNLCIVALPNLGLVKQTVDVIDEQQKAKREHWNWICVCSEANDDPSVKRNTTNIDEIVKWYNDTNDSNDFRVIFTTYQSGKILSAALDGISVDMTIFDESHRATGKKTGLWCHLLTNNNLKSDKRWFITATPKINRKNNPNAYGMDNKEIYGENITTISYRDLLKYKMVTPYALEALWVTSEDIKIFINENIWIKINDFDNETQSRFVAALFALHQAYDKKIVTRVISYHGRNIYAERFKEVIDKIAEVKHPKFPAFWDLKTYQCEGGDTKGNDAKLKTAAKDSKALILNCRVLTEGVDVPAVDGCIFVDPRKSLIDINQAVGRIIRLNIGKEFGTVILPAVYGDNGIEDETYRNLGAVLWHVSEIDEILMAEINFVRDREGVKPFVEPNSNPIDIFQDNLPDYLDIDFDEFYKNIRLYAVKFDGYSRDYNKRTDEELKELFIDCKNLRECRLIDEGRPAITYINRGLADKRWPNRSKSKKRSPNEIINGLTGCSTSGEAVKKDNKLWQAAQREEIKNPGFIEFTLKIKIRKNKTSKYTKDDYDNFIEKNNITKLSEFKDQVNLPFYQRAVGKKWTANLEQDVKIGMPGKSIMKKTLDGIFIEQFNSATEASNKTGISLDSICGCAKGRYKSSISPSGEKYLFEYIK